MATLCTSWTADEGPPVVTVMVQTACDGPVTRECQDTHDAHVVQGQRTQPPVPGTPIVHLVKEDDGTERELRREAAPDGGGRGGL